MHRLVPVFALLGLSLPALAVPTTANHQGRLMDGSGVPLTGTQTVDFALFDVETGGSSVWTESIDVDFDNGYYSVTLGETAALDATVIDGGDLWVELTVAAGTPLPRLGLHSVPYAIRAGVATEADGLVAGSVVDASEVRINGTTVIDSGGIVGASDTLASLVCNAGDVAFYDGSDWDCAAPALPSHTHVAADVTSGQFDIARIPVGTTSAHVAAGDHSHTAADVGAIPVGGGVPLGPSTTCDTAAAGTLRWTSGVQYCDGTAWRSIPTGADGASAASAAASCWELHSQFPSLGDGVYWLRASNGEAYEAYCDMTTNGGGWTLLMSADADGTRFGNNSPEWSAAAWDTTVPTGLVDAEFKSRAYVDLPTNEVLLCYQDATNCTAMPHRMGMSLYSFFANGQTYTHYSQGSAGYTDVGTVALLDDYLTDLGGFTVIAETCYWIGINETRSISSIGLLGDRNSGCTTGQHDDLALGLGLQSCYDNNGCGNGGTGHANGDTRAVNGVEDSGNFGPWHVLAR